MPDFSFFFFNFIYLFIFRERERGKRETETSMCERNTDWLPLAHSQLGTWPVTQACALTRSQSVTFQLVG